MAASTAGPQGMECPPDAPRPTVRTYTPRRFRPEAGEPEVEFALQGAGAARARRGHGAGARHAFVCTLS
jgi:NADPH-dependent ferric siderophore reductase